MPWNAIQLGTLPLPGNSASLKHYAKYSNGMEIAGGYTYDLPNGSLHVKNYRFYSKDGRIWELLSRTSPSLFGHTWMKKGGNSYYLCGYKAATFNGPPSAASLTDIIGQTGRSDTYPFATFPKAVAYHTSMVSQGKAWLVGGIDAGGASDEVYSSSNMVDWSLVGTMPMKLYAHALLKKGGKLYISGGVKDDGSFNSMLWDVGDLTDVQSWDEVYDYADHGGTWENGFAFHDMYISGKDLHIMNGQGKDGTPSIINIEQYISLNLTTLTLQNIALPGHMGGYRNVFQKSNNDFIQIGRHTDLDKTIRLMEYTSPF